MIDRDLLPHLVVVVTVARRGGFAAAAAELGMSPSTVTNAIKVVETRLGQALFLRTTRSVALTEAGTRLLERIGPALGDIGAAWNDARNETGVAVGRLRINTPRVAVPMALAPLVAQMARAHPLVQIELVIQDALVDIVAEGHDAGVRLGEMIAPDMVAVRLTAPFKAMLCASPDYLAGHPPPTSIEGLSSHNLIGLRFSPTKAPYDWDVRVNGSDATIRAQGSAIVPDPLSARDLALAGVGVAYLYEPLVRADIVGGRLVEILPEASMAEPGLFLYFPRAASTTPKLRAFLNVVKAART